MDHKYKYLAKNVGILSISNFASKILVFFMVPIYTSVLSTTDYGIYDLIRTTISILIPIFSANIGEGVMRFALDKETDKKSVISVGAYYVIICLLTGLLGTFALQSMNIWPWFKGLEWLSFGYYATMVIESYLGQTAKGLDKVKVMGIAGVVSTITMIGLNILFLKVLQLGLKAFFVANIIALGITSFYYIFSLQIWKYIGIRLDYKLKRKMLYYSLPLVVTAIGWTINSSLDKYVVSFFCGTAATGLVAIAYKIPNILDALKTVFIQAWQLSAINEISEKDSSHFYDGMFSFISAALCLTCGILILLTRPLAALLFKNDFYEAWKYVPVLIVSVVFNSMAGFLGPILTAQYKSREIAYSAIAGITVNFFGNIVLVKLFGVQGAIIATAISSLAIYCVRRIFVGDIISKKNDICAVAAWCVLAIMATCEIVACSIGVNIALFALIALIYRRTLFNNVKKLYKMIFGR